MSQYITHVTKKTEYISSLDRGVIKCIFIVTRNFLICSFI